MEVNGVKQSTTTSIVMDKLPAEEETSKEPQRPRTPSNDLSEDISEHSTTVAHVCLVFFCAYIVYLCTIQQFEFFTWHPLLYAIGWLLLMTEAVLMIAPDNVVSSRLPQMWRVRCHWMIQIVAVSCSLAGFVVVLVNKENKHKKHFKSYHGIFGLLSMVCALIPTCLSGLPALFNVELRRFIAPKLNKFIHSTSGIISVFFGGITLILALYTNWFAKRTNDRQDVFIICFIAVVFGVFGSLWRPLITFYQRLVTL